MTQILILMTLISSAAFGHSSIHEFSFRSIDGKEHKMSEFKGKKMLIVNTASKCGFTPQYQALQEVHERYGEDVVIIGFPANNFGGQEPGTNGEIEQFCQKNYGVSFLMAEKVSVKGADISPLFKWLCAQENDSFTGPINWNFEKFLINEEGKLIARYRSAVKPNAEVIVNRFES